MQFTPQQLAGGHKYSAKTKVGNWYEDALLEEAKYADFQRTYTSGTLALRKQEEKKARCLKHVPHTHCEDGCVHFGDYLVLEHPMTGTTVSCDPEDDFPPGSGRYFVTASVEQQAIARNTFKVMPAPRSESQLGDTLKLGEPFMLMCNEALLTQPGAKFLRAPCYLASSLKSESSAARVSNNQAVFLSTSANADAVWVVSRLAEQADGLGAFLHRGAAVPVNTLIILTHRASNRPLACDPQYTDLTAFGRELEVYCELHRTRGKPGCLLAESTGRATAQTLSQRVLQENAFMFASAPNADSMTETRDLPPAPTPTLLLEELRRTILERCNGGFVGLRNIFRRLDGASRPRDGQIDREDLKLGLMQMPGMASIVNDANIDMLLDIMDRDNDGQISMNEFFRAMRGDLNDRRLELVDLAFQRIDKHGRGRVTLAEMAQMYDASRHPDVVSGKSSQSSVMREFLRVWDKNGDDVVTQEEFRDYYADLSAEIDNEDYFELMIRNAWHISGGVGAAENTTCLRVLVEHSDGSQEVVEVKDDLGLNTSDMAAIRRRLEEQGVHDVHTIMRYT